MMYISVLEAKSRKNQIEIRIIMKCTSYVKQKEKEGDQLRLGWNIQEELSEEVVCKQGPLKYAGLGQEGREGLWEEGTV